MKPSTKRPWRDRFRSIRHFEAHLHRNGTRIIKFFLDVSKKEQRKRFLARLEQPDKNWKFNRKDLEERKYWNDYMRAYQACLSATSTTDSPWYAVPADDKRNARLIISQIILDTLQRLKMKYPTSQKSSVKNWRKYASCSPNRPLAKPAYFISYRLTVALPPCSPRACF